MMRQVYSRAAGGARLRGQSLSILGLLKALAVFKVKHRKSNPLRCHHPYVPLALKCRVGADTPLESTACG